MKKFNSKFIEGKTRVTIEGIRGWFVVKEIHGTRLLIKVAGVEGSFQRAHITKFTNKEGE